MNPAVVDTCLSQKDYSGGVRRLNEHNFWSNFTHNRVFPNVETQGLADLLFPTNRVEINRCATLKKQAPRTDHSGMMARSFKGGVSP
jgi:hypothetical protein